MIRLATWNMQGSNASTLNKWNTGAKSLFTQEKLDFLCLQECGDNPPSIRWLTASSASPALGIWGGTESRPGLYVLFYPWDSGGNRCNLAVLSRAQPKAWRHVLSAQQPRWRPAVGIETDQLFVFTIHAISPGGSDAPGLIKQVAGTANGKPWVIAGDFNRHPDTMEGFGLVCHPASPTHPSTAPKSKLDYAVKSWGQKARGRVIDLQLSDHLPVVFEL